MAAEGAKLMAKQANVITINIRRARPAQAMARHIIHLAVKAGIEPLAQARLGIGQIDAGHPRRAEAQLARPLRDLRRQRGAVIGQALRRHDRPPRRPRPEETADPCPHRPRR